MIVITTDEQHFLIYKLIRASGFYSDPSLVNVRFSTPFVHSLRGSCYYFDIQQQDVAVIDKPYLRCCACSSYLGSGNMYLDHPIITATHSLTEPDRIERLNRVYGYMVGEADDDKNSKFIQKLAQLHDDRGTLTVFWHEQLTDKEKQYCINAWMSLIGDGTSNVQFALNPPKPAAKPAA
jgi:hypothetical protein